LKAGARGFLLKDAGPALLTQAIHAAARGDALIAPSITARLLAGFTDNRARARPPQPIEPLTSREEQVLIPVAQGWTNSEIADDLHISIQHRQDPPRQPHAQARRPKPRRDRDVGLRDGPHQDLTIDTEPAVAAKTSLGPRGEGPYCPKGQKRPPQREAAETRLGGGVGPGGGLLSARVHQL
jgi:hypothetical protein